MANVAGTVASTFQFSQTPSAGFLTGQPFAINEVIATVLRSSGVLADQVDGIHAKTYTFVASTPQTVNLTTLTDVLGGSITAARVRLIAFKVKWTTDNKPLIVGLAAATPTTILTNAAGSLNVYPSSLVNDGWTIFTAPQTTGMVIGSAVNLKLDPGTAAGDVDIIIATCST